VKLIAMNGTGVVPGSAVTVELTRRNLTALLQKLDAKRDGHQTECALLKSGTETDGFLLRVEAVEDEAHYSTRRPGAMMDPRTGDLW
jgi:hypothetical protein